MVPVHRGHRWGVLRCTVCGANPALWSSSRIPEDTAKRVRKSDLRHRHEEE